MKKNKKVIMLVFFVILIAIIFAVVMNPKIKSSTDKNTIFEHSSEDGEGEENLFSEDSEESKLSASNSATPSANTNSTVESETKGSVHFPYTIPGSDLVIQKISSYNGIFLEDGFDENVSDIAVIALKNTGSVDVEYANITLSQNDTFLQFEASVIPAGEVVVVQEKDKKACLTEGYTSCTGDVAEISSFEMSEDMVEISENENNSLTIKNLTNQEIPCVRVFYKFYMEDEKTYVGGITYNAKVEGLVANGSQTISPSHYVNGYSQIVMVRTYFE